MLWVTASKMQKFHFNPKSAKVFTGYIKLYGFTLLVLLITEDWMGIGLSLKRNIVVQVAGRMSLLRSILKLELIVTFICACISIIKWNHYNFFLKKN